MKQKLVLKKGYLFYPSIYLLLVIGWIFFPSVYTFIFKDFSNRAYVIFERINRKETVELGPFTQVFAITLVVWCFVFLSLLICLFFSRNKATLPGLYVTITIHIVLLLLFFLAPYF